MLQVQNKNSLVMRIFTDSQSFDARFTQKAVHNQTGINAGRGNSLMPLVPQFLLGFRKPVCGSCIVLHQDPFSTRQTSRPIIQIHNSICTFCKWEYQTFELTFFPYGINLKSRTLSILDHIEIITFSLQTILSDVVRDSCPVVIHWILRSGIRI